MPKISGNNYYTRDTQDSSAVTQHEHQRSEHQRSEHQRSEHQRSEGGEGPGRADLVLPSPGHPAGEPSWLQTLGSAAIPTAEGLGLAGTPSLGGGTRAGGERGPGLAASVTPW